MPSIRARLLDWVSEPVIAVAGGEAARVDDGSEVVVRVEAELRDAAAGIGDLLEAVEGVVLVRGVAREWRTDRGLIAVAVVAEARGDRRGAG